jgi:hypothetical protein
VTAEVAIEVVSAATTAGTGASSEDLVLAGLVLVVLGAMVVIAARLEGRRRALSRTDAAEEASGTEG